MEMTQNLKYGEYWVGVDGGGTKCRAELFNEFGESLGQGVGGPPILPGMGSWRCRRY